MAKVATVITMAARDQIRFSERRFIWRLPFFLSDDDFSDCAATWH
jgi:hypothetical protein